MPIKALILRRLVPIVTCFLYWHCQNVINIEIDKAESCKPIKPLFPNVAIWQLDQHFSQARPEDIGADVQA